MLKIAVFGIGRGGEAVAEYLSTELNIVEIIEVIDWSNPASAYCGLEEIYQTACCYLLPHIGKVDLVILADYTLSLVVHSLKARWPEQKIIGMEIDFRHILKSCQHANVVTLFANELLLKSDLGKEIYQRLSFADIILPDCSNWERLIDMGDMSKDVLEIGLGKTFVLANHCNPGSRLQGELLLQRVDLRAEVIKFLMRASPATRLRVAMAGVGYMGEELDSITVTASAQRRKKVWSTQVIYILGTHFWNIEQDLQEIFGYGVAVVDFRRKLLHDVCLALGLRGVDGRLGE